MSRTAIAAIVAAVVVTIGVQGVCFGADAPGADKATPPRSSIVVTAPEPITAQEMAGYTRLQETARETGLLDSSVASIEDSEMIAAYLVSFTLYAAAIGGAVALALM